jgi:hypothetical protein
MSYNAGVYREQGSLRLVVQSGSQLDIESGGELDVESGGALKLAGVAITATADEINRAADMSGRVVNHGGTAALALTADAHDGRIVALSGTVGVAVTLPAATGTGAHFTLLQTAPIGSGSTTISVAGTADVMQGVALMAADGGDSVVGFETAADSDRINWDGSTQGGLAGARAELIDVAAGKWWVHVTGAATGSEATPFSASV